MAGAAWQADAGAAGRAVDVPARVLWGIAAACVAALAAALVAQYVYDIRPCPWCVLQRLVYVLIAVAAAGGALARNVVPRRAALGVVALLSAGGVACAVYQHVVAAKQFSCDLSFADKLITALHLESLVPSLFAVTATCAEAAVSVVGVPFEFWSLALYALLAVAAVGLWPRVSAAGR